jgi:hypothetical protein
MGDYYSVRLWQLKPGNTGADLEALAASGYLEMQRWIPGVKHLLLLRAAGERKGRYVLTTTFESFEAYRYWRQIEEEAPDYWERYAAIAMQWEQICFLVDEYVGEMALDTGVDAVGSREK